jgi:hypothetical protein
MCLGQFQEVIAALQTAIDRAVTGRPHLRRLMATAYQVERKGDWRKMKAGDVVRIYRLMSENLEEEPARGSDVLMWFNAFRRMKEFDLLEAIEKFHSWSLLENSVEAEYYLYCLYFLRWQLGTLTTHGVVQEHMDRCRELAGSRRRVFSREWFARSPDWCPLINEAEIGEWDDVSQFFKHPESLARTEARIKNIKGPQSGVLRIGPFEAFFVPGEDFLPGRDEGKRVDCYLGFSYVGLRAWKARPA